MSAHFLGPGVSANYLPGAGQPYREMPTLLPYPSERAARAEAAAANPTSKLKKRTPTFWPRGFTALSDKAFFSLLRSTVKEFDRVDALSAQEEEAKRGQKRKEAQEALEKRLDEKDTVITCRHATKETACCFEIGSTTVEKPESDEEEDIACICSTCCSRGRRNDCTEAPQRRRRSHSECAAMEEKTAAAPDDRGIAEALLNFQTVPIDLPEARASAREKRRNEGVAAIVSGGGDVIDMRHYGVADTGANAHCVSKHLRLTNPRVKKLWMRDAAGKSTLLDRAGDFEIPCVDYDGNHLEPMLVQNASVVPDSPFNLLSISLLCERGVSFHFAKDESYMLYKKVRYKLIKHNGLYLINLNKVLEPDEAAAMGMVFGSTFPEPTVYKDEEGAAFFSAGDWSLWHERLGHSSKARLRFLFNNSAVEGMKVKGNPKVCARGCGCEVCRMSEKRRRHIPGQRQFQDPVCRPGELVYSDVCGPFPPSVQGYRYAISFTDQLTRFSVCYLLKSKSDSSGALRAAHEFFAQHNIILSKVRSDQGGEYSGSNERDAAAGEAGRINEIGGASRKKKGAPASTGPRRKEKRTGQSLGGADDDQLAYGEKFQAVCKELKIVHELMPAKVPQLHGLAERWNATVTRMANSMLYNARLSYLLWPEAIAHANYLRNRLPVRGLGPITPYELFVGRRPRVDDLRVFGSDAYKLLTNYPKTPGNNARQRLLYVGHSANRVGFRCFNPITYKFSTEFELIFDEESGKKRMNQLRQHDIRRELLRRGKLDTLPLIQDDYSSSPSNDLNVRQQDIQRRLFNDPSAEAVELGGGEPGQRPRSSRKGKAQGKLQRDHGRKEDNSASSSTTKVQPALGKQTRIRSESAESNGGHELRRSSRRVNNRDIHSQGAPLWDGSNAASEHPAGSQPASSSQPIDLLDGTAEAREPPDEIRTGPEPEMPPEFEVADSPMNIRLDEQDEGDLHSNDAMADKFGPLTENQMQKEKALLKFDPTRPMRPVRVVPIGVPEDDTEEFKKFRLAAFENDYPIQFIPNPKLPGSKSFKRYTRYSQANTLREVVELSVKGRSAKSQREERQKALADIIHDSLRGFIIWPQHEHASTAHYLDASSVARAANTINVMALWSEEELAKTREEAKEEHASAVLAAIEKFESDRRVARGAEIMETMDACRTYGTAFMANAFQEQVASLWSREDGSYQRDGQRHADLFAAATMVEGLLVEDIPTPSTYNKAIAKDNPYRQQWLESMKRERTTLAERGTWEMVPITELKGRKPIGSRYVYRVKRNLDRSVQFKSRLVAQGFTQREGLDYSLNQIYAGVVSYSSMRFLLSLACQNDMVVSQTDITGAYLESHLTEDLWMTAPPDMFVGGKPPKNEDGIEMVCKMKRGLYGLKQSGHLWSKVFKNFLLATPSGVPTSRVKMDENSGDVRLEEKEIEDVGDGSIDLSKCQTDRDYAMGFHELTGDNSLYRKRFILNGREETILLGCYVDDCVICCSSEEARQYFMKRLEHRFPVNAKSTGVIQGKKLGHILSMEVKYDKEKGVLSINQREAIEALARKHNLHKDAPRKLPITSDCQLPKLSAAEVSQTEYLSLVGSCLHIAQVSRPDIGYAIGVLSRHSQCPGHQHYEAAKNLIRYLYGSRYLNIVYRRCKEHGNEPTVYERGGRVPAKVPAEESIERRLKASTPEEGSSQAEMYVDADYGGEKNTFRSTSGILTMMNGGPISWASRLQKMVAQSSAESEVLAVVDSMKEALHLKLLSEECGIRQHGKPIRIWEDNVAAILLGEKMKNSRQTKHFAVRLRFMYEHITEKTIQFWKVDTLDQLADGLTKALKGPAFEVWRSRLLAGSKEDLTEHG